MKWHSWELARTGRLTVKNKTSRINKQTITIVVGVIFGLLLADFLITGYIKFGFNYIRCGRAPVEVVSSPYFGGGSSYTVPGDSEYKVRGINQYFCTEEEAEANYIQINPLSDEGIRRADEQNKQLEKENQQRLDQLRREAQENQD